MNSKTTHSVMFHHFHSKKHLKAQGSLSKMDFSSMIDWLDKNYTILNADEYLQKLEKKSINKNDICISFDDALLSQFDIALPVLKKRGITAFYFVPSSVFTDNPDLLEVYRYFRINEFKTIDEFYDEFFNNVKFNNIEKYERIKKKYERIDFLPSHKFYSESDKWFRYLRDYYLKNEEYNKIMKDMMDKKKFNPKKIKQKLWMNENCLKKINQDKNIIGLHSFSHPTKMSKLPYKEQFNEYSKNLFHLENILGKNTIQTVSHPCGDYNQDTLKILKNLKIKFGFRQNMEVKEIKSMLEIPREDQANIFREMKF